MRAIAKRLDMGKIAADTSFSELFGVLSEIFRDQEVAGSNPVTPIHISLFRLVDYVNNPLPI
jgi:hypothetical protein